MTYPMKRIPVDFCPTQLDLRVYCHAHEAEQNAHPAAFPTLQPVVFAG